MIHLFRNIRKGLINRNKFNKYLLYAIGEIVLVVVGILIALNINNWNEERKQIELERSYLTGILDDLKTDTATINSDVLPNFRDNHRPNHRYLDSLERNNLFNDDSLVSKATHPLAATASGLSFHPTIGTYRAMMSAGNSELIRDRDIFNDLQKLYEVWYKRNDEYSQRRDKLMDEIVSRHAVNFKNDTKKELLMNREIMADLWMMYRSKGQYVGLVSDIEREIEKTSKKIEDYLSNEK